MLLNHYTVDRWKVGSISMTATATRNGTAYRLKRYLNPPWPADGNMRDARVQEQARRCERLLQERVDINRRLMSAGGRSGCLACAEEVFLCKSADAPGVVEAVREVQALRPVDQLRENPKWLLRAMVSAADAVRRLHDARIVHADLKPENILYCACGVTGRKVRAVLIDFDRSYIVDRVPGSEDIGVSPGFMAPEAVAYYNDEDCDDDGHDSRYRGMLSVKRDIFSLGAVYYHLLTGKSPITTTGDIEVNLRSAPRGLRPEKLEPLLRSMLALEPSARPTAAEVMAQLKKL